jgi:DNA-binding MarR family transcriptional regulator
MHPQTTICSTPRVRESASRVIEVVPALMDAIRMVMRQGVGDQLSVPQFRCLNFIADQPGCSVGAIAGFLGVTMPTASAMVDRLVKSGAVASQAATEDRRRSQLQPTHDGLDLLAQIRQGAQLELERVLATCTPQDLDTINSGLITLLHIFRPHLEQS